MSVLKICSNGLPFHSRYNEKSDIYSLAVTACEMANGLVPFSEMPGTLMLLEKLRGAAPKLLDKSTFDDNVDDYPSQPTDANCGVKETVELKNSEQKIIETEQSEGIGLTTSKKPGDSGVGVSVGSSFIMTSTSSKQLSQVSRSSLIMSWTGLENSVHPYTS